MGERTVLTDEIDITDEVLNYSTKELATLLLFLDRNNFKNICFDGCEASISVIRKKYYPDGI